MKEEPKAMEMTTQNNQRPKINKEETNQINKRFHMGQTQNHEIKNLHSNLQKANRKKKMKTL